MKKLGRIHDDTVGDCLTMARHARRTRKTVATESPSRSLTPFVTPLGLIAIGIALYVPGIQWGLPGVVSWSQDTIAGMRTIGAVEGWPQEWHGRYPPGQYMLLRAAYQPVLSNWDATGQRYVDPQSGERVLKPPHTPKISKLFYIARLVSIVMALGAVLGIWATARELVRDEFAIAIGAIGFMSCAGFTYFARLGNVDVPSVCWFTWSLFFYVRALRSRSLLNAALLGFFGALAISTKDSIAGMYPGMAVSLLWFEFNHLKAVGGPGNPRLKAIFQPRWLVGITLFALPYLFINGAFANWSGYEARMLYWLDPAPTTLHAQQYHQPTQFHLLWETIRCAATSMGWPMVLAFAGAVFYILKHHRKLAWIVLPPVIGYYLIVIIPTGFVYERFLFPMLAVLCIPTGLVASAVFRMRRLRPAWRVASICVVLIPSLAYTTALNVEVMNDSRYDAEDWIADNIPIETSIGSLVNDLDRPFKPQYQPRVHEMGYPTFPVVARIASFDSPQPDVLILSSYDRDDFHDEQKACIDDLLSGRLGYEPVERFAGHYLGTGRSWLAIAGWFTPTPGKISPTITIFRRVDRLPLDLPAANPQ